MKILYQNEMKYLIIVICNFYNEIYLTNRTLILLVIKHSNDNIENGINYDKR